jgi:hypothetical protein
LTPTLARLVSDPEGGSLRQWLDHVLAGSQERAMALVGRAQANLVLSREGADAKEQWSLADLSAQAPTSKGRIAPSGLRAAARLYLDAGAPQGSFAVMDETLLGRWDGAQGSGKVLAVLAPAAQGGGIRILYESADGPSAAAKLLSGLGFSVDLRGKDLSASLEASASDAGGAALSATLSRAVVALQSGRDPGPSQSGAEVRREASAGVAKLVSDLKRQRAAAAAVAQALQSSAPESLRFVTIGRVNGSTAQSARLALDDGRVLSVYALKDAESGLFSAARAELGRPGEKTAVVPAQELGALLRGE